jgi:E3 SUMO-protein ligase PIAS1
MPQNRHTVRADIKLSEDHVRRLKDDSNLKLLMYCGQTGGSGMNAYTAMDVAFPNQIEVKVNNDDVKSNFKGLKNKPGSTKPADITAYVRKIANYATPISVCYALTAKKYAFEVRLVRHITADELTQRIRGASVITSDRVIAEMARANADPDISATSSKMSLKDPVSTMRITLPIRSNVCQHNQCFDGATFMQLQEQAPTWQCPICSKAVSFESLCVDQYFQKILATTSSDTEQVTIEPDGQWRVEAEDEDKGKSNQAKGGERASYDKDFSDDDVVEVVDEPPRPRLNGSRLSYSAMETPPLSSREPSVATNRPATGSKRTAEIIDLISDDEDEPPRPAKRFTTGNHPGPVTHAYNTPTSQHDPHPPRYQAYTQQPAESSNMRMSPFSTHPANNVNNSMTLAPMRTTSESPVQNYHNNSNNAFAIRPASASNYDRSPLPLPSIPSFDSANLRLPVSRPPTNPPPDPFPGFRNHDSYYPPS